MNGYIYLELLVILYDDKGLSIYTGTDDVIPYNQIGILLETSIKLTLDATGEGRILVAMDS